MEEFSPFAVVIWTLQTVLIVKFGPFHRVCKSSFQFGVHMLLASDASLPSRQVALRKANEHYSIGLLNSGVRYRVFCLCIQNFRLEYYTNLRFPCIILVRGTATSYGLDSRGV
jgi:hypothetical protein